MGFNNNKSRNILRIINIALQDALLLMLIGSLGLLIMEAAIPGFISTRLSFAIVGIAIAMIFLANIAISKFIGNSYQLHKTKHLPFVPFFTIILLLFAGNTLLRLPLWQNLLISVVLTVSFSLVLDSYLFNKHKK